MKLFLKQGKVTFLVWLVFCLFLFFVPFTQGSSHLPVVLSSWNQQARRENCLILSTSFFLSPPLCEWKGVLYLSDKGCGAFSCCRTLGHQSLKARMRYNCINVWKQCGYWVQVNIIIRKNDLYINLKKKSKHMYLIWLNLLFLWNLV